MVFVLLCGYTNDIHTPFVRGGGCIRACLVNLGYALLYCVIILGVALYFLWGMQQFVNCAG